jgi:hypothetical protein
MAADGQQGCTRKNSGKTAVFQLVSPVFLAMLHGNKRTSFMLLKVAIAFCFLPSP